MDGRMDERIDGRMNGWAHGLACERAVELVGGRGHAGGPAVEWASVIFIT